MLCGYCAKEFTPKRQFVRAKWCSPRCRLRAWIERQVREQQGVSQAQIEEALRVLRAALKVKEKTLEHDPE